MSDVIDQALPQARAVATGDTPKVLPKRRGKGGGVGWPTYVFLVVAVLVSVFPLYYMFVIASVGATAVTSIPPRLYPGTNFFAIAEKVFDTVPFIASLFNSLIVSLSIAVLSAILCAMAGFAFAKLQFPGRNVLFLIVLLTMTVPAQLSIIPQYLIVSALDWVDTLQAIIVPGLASAFGIFWMRQHMSTTVSDELIQAARIDGANSWQLFWRIAFPVVRPAAFVLGLITFTAVWNDFMWPFIVLKSPELFTVQIALKQLQANRSIDVALAMGGSFMATLPLLIAFFFVGRRMVSGIMDGAFKG
ncbi:MULTISPECIES: carbohydrate ABC transporter permease [unclassified Rathayibacter]|jgi:cellobiose transport system permease protein|uniref:carbohydrate ABC transporter permease n=1 Tax=unclassified Rathayibacter TaxID=2609250 RepID=UPI000F4C4FBB|nr:MULTISPECIES: carbohydrate ABC transporter permease [unclassified Rathayibacter]MCJ1671683.1 carbohydrate ABC transporter permease [Rathayibacter sp. VKM Ac-2929]ROP49302.1 carbohydrate ABC transporter membrane protein 2 (CUT1 family) [Rathayibacter sp. PhB186]ROQ60528.1 carbohydrate ABC transporter membrane protein 2 (CUT1 family) [Rathayibacter sp. PhB152]ROS21708.1 carbohydrate ABC transporter membrane protein 2 (CUT1 family) [Rathayibacter sp. PhB127]ROS50581.1 carbohydrate ABC transpor